MRFNSLGRWVYSWVVLNSTESTSCSAHRGPSNSQEPLAKQEHELHCPSHSWVGPRLEDATILHDFDLQTGFSFLAPLQRRRRPRGPELVFQNDLPNGHLEHPNSLLLEGLCHFLHIPRSSKIRLLTLKNEAYTWRQLAFWRMKVRPWFTAP